MGGSPPPPGAEDGRASRQVVDLIERNGLQIVYAARSKVRSPMTFGTHADRCAGRGAIELPVPPLLRPSPWPDRHRRGNRGSPRPLRERLQTGFAPPSFSNEIHAIDEPTTCAIAAPTALATPAFSGTDNCEQPRSGRSMENAAAADQHDRYVDWR